MRYPSPAKRTRFDARRATFLAYPFKSLYPFSIGKKSTASGTCVVGGTVIGQQSRTLTWDQMKSSYDGDGLRIASNNPYVVDGFRADNVEDGVAPRGTEDRYPKDGDGFTLKNLYFKYIRDDCVENDDIAGGVIFDSLFDGCYTGVSERPSDASPQLAHPAPRGETLLLDHVLLRLQAMSGPRGTDDPGLRGHGQLFKWSSVANSLVVKDSIFLIEDTPNSTSYFPFPTGTKTVGVTLVWRGPGRFRWNVPAGTIVTTDRSIWDRARALWLKRHGCTSFLSCSRLTAPLPLTVAEPGASSSSVPKSRLAVPPVASSLERSSAVTARADSLPRIPLILAVVALAGALGSFVMVTVPPPSRWTRRRVPSPNLRAPGGEAASSGLTGSAEAAAKAPVALDTLRSGMAWVSSVRAWRSAVKGGPDGNQSPVDEPVLRDQLKHTSDA